MGNPDFKASPGLAEYIKAARGKGAAVRVRLGKLATAGYRMRNGRLV